MIEQSTSPYLNLLKNKIDIIQVPFSDRGSRLLVYKYEDQDCLYVKLAERLSFLDSSLEAYLDRPPFIADFCFVDQERNPLSFDVISFPHALEFHTVIGDFGLVFQDERTISLGIPTGKIAGIRFHISPQYWVKSMQGGHFKFIRNMAYTTNGEIVRNEIIPEKGGYSVEFVVQANEDCAITITIDEKDPSHEPLPYSVSLSSSMTRWSNWFQRVPSVLEEYRSVYAYAWWIMASNLISPRGSVVYEAMMPSKNNYVGLWLWDSAMHALAYRYVDPELARNQIRAMISCQLPDGMLPDAVYDEGVISEIDHPIKAEVTKPPILAWAALKLHETAPDLEFLEEIYIPLVRWNAWWFSMNDDNVDGLAQYNHPYSSGLDNNPLWDYGMPVESPDLNTYLCVQMGSLAVMAEELGLVAEGAMWRRRAAAIVQRMINSFWDDRAGVFQALQDGNPIPVLTPFNLYPIWTGQLPDAIKHSLVSHLLNPDEFWGEYPIPSVARNDPHYDPESMWRGPVWANINYFFIEALHQAGYHNEAVELRDKTLKLIKSQTSIYEYYNAETGIPPEKAADIFGWSAAVFIDLVIKATEDASSSN
jgi:glycogen debranching enzyme